MPLSSEKQRRFIFSELGRAKKGKKTKTGLGVDKLTEMAHAPLKKKKKKDYLVGD